MVVRIVDISNVTAEVSKIDEASMDGLVSPLKSPTFNSLARPPIFICKCSKNNYIFKTKLLSITE
jgi:hypothetical protein